MKDSINNPDEIQKVLAENEVLDSNGGSSAGPITIPKPNGFDINKFKSKRADAIANVDTLQTGLPVGSMSQGPPAPG